MLCVRTCQMHGKWHQENGKPVFAIQLKCQGNKIFKNLLTLTLRYSLE